MTFRCERCGACCRHIGGIDDLRHLDRGDGVCRHLTDDNACAVYDERPRVCRVDEMCPPVMTLDEWYRRNESACERLHLRVYGSPLMRGAA